MTNFTADTLAPFIELAHKLADAARGEILPRYRKPIAIDDKQDDSPVTEADKGAERAMRVLIEATFPEHGIVGEEEEDRNPGADWVWILDPIDGTKAFITGVPLFATLIALTYKGESVIGVADQAVLDERWLGIAGQETTLNGSPVSTRACKALSTATFHTTGFEYYREDLLPKLFALRDACKLIRYSADPYGSTLLAQGFFDVNVEHGIKPWDVMALIPIIEGAGGVTSDWHGNKIRADEFDGSFLAVGDPELQAEALAMLKD